MKLSGIFKVLITVAACIIVGAVVLNVLLPNTVTQLSGVVETAIYKATGLSFDFNGDGIAGDAAQSLGNTETHGNYEDELTGTVEGFN